MTTFVQTINGLLILNNDATTMKNFYFLLISSLFLTSGLYAGETDYTQGLSIWFDTPNTLQGYAAWYGGRPDLWKGENKPITAGSGRNLDASW